jgi:AraC-like DNA-binding protein/mannose-6-phosphate isomerase-like protein (cupin superfamily)
MVSIRRGNGQREFAAIALVEMRELTGVASSPWPVLNGPTKSLNMDPRQLKMDPLLISELFKFVLENVPPKRFGVPPHLHHFHHFDFVLGGHVSVLVEHDKLVPLTRGDGMLMPPLVRHEYRATRGFRKGVFKFHVSPQYWPLIGVRPRKVRLSEGLVACLDAWGRRYEACAARLKQEAIALASLCLLETLAHERTRVRGPDHLDAFREQLWPVLERIAHDPHAGWTVAQLARECKLSADRFSRQFHEVLGESPQHYLLIARVRDVAVELGSHPTRPIKEIAERARYSSVHSLTRAFTDAFGVSPAVYRRMRDRHDEPRKRIT